MIFCTRCKGNMGINTLFVDGSFHKQDVLLCSKCGHVDVPSTGKTMEFDARVLNKLISKSSKKWWQVWR